VEEEGEPEAAVEPETEVEVEHETEVEDQVEVEPEAEVEPEVEVEHETEVEDQVEVEEEDEEEKAAIEENEEGKGEAETNFEKLQALVPRRVSFTIPDTVRAGRFVYKVTGVTHDVFGRPLCAYKPTSLTERHTKVHLPQLIE